MAYCFLNIDLGELRAEPEELYMLADVANIACGGHAGDDASMAHALALCARHGTRAGAHPSYLDRKGFGRIPQDIESGLLRAIVAEQCRCLASQATRSFVAVEYIKPHGALYHTCNFDARIARAVIAGAVDALGSGICVIGPAAGVMEAETRAAGLTFAREGFADRGRRKDGSLISRTEPGAFINDPAEAKALALELVRTASVDTLCIHGDTPNAVPIARTVRAALQELVSSQAPAWSR